MYELIHTKTRRQCFEGFPLSLMPENRAKKWIRVLSISVSIIPTSFNTLSNSVSFCQIQANPSGAEFLRPISKLRKPTENFVVACLRPPQNVKDWAFSRRSRVVTAKKCTKKACCTCFVVLLNKNFRFFDALVTVAAVPRILNSQTRAVRGCYTAVIAEKLFILSSQFHLFRGEKHLTGAAKVISFR